MIAGTVGTSIEWYDFFLYGTAAALVFPHLFFPGASAYAGALASFATYAVGFAARPVGAAIFGHFGDRIGRKATLISTLLLMGIASTLIGVLPGYATLGFWAPTLLVLLRLIQGIGVGGEWGGSVTLCMEWGNPKRRGFVGSWPQVGVPIGLLLSTGAVSLLTHTMGDSFETWGWRLPFLFSIVLVGVGLWVRLGVLESPLFAREVENDSLEKHAAARDHQARAARDHPQRAAAHVRADAVLHLHRLRARLRDRGPRLQQGLPHQRGDGGRGAVALHASRSSGTSPTRSGASGCT